MKTKLFGNPFYCYIFSFGIAFFIYSWGWSEIYPALTIDVILFLLSSFIIAFIIGKKIERRLNYNNIIFSHNNRLVIYIIFLSYSLELIYNGGIPILFIFKGIDISYMEFGIPTFHVLLHTFTCFYTVYIYHQYVSSRQKELLIMFIIFLLPNLLIINRGALIMTISACLIIYLLSIKKILLKPLIILFISACVFFYGFGYLGNSRSFNGDNTAFLRITKASDEFMESLIPNEYYWFYIYASSPFANFQNATIESKNHRYDFVTFVTWELLPDFISKRIVSAEVDYDGKNRLDYSINPILTVGSIFFEPYIRMGWFGPIIVFLFYVIFAYFYILILPRRSQYFISAVAILCVISVFNIFENMINFSGLSLQLLFPLILNIFEKYKIKFYGLKIKKINIKLFKA